MSRVRNADEFLIRFRGIRKAYESLFAYRIAQIRQKYVGKPEEGLLDNMLEAHARAYIVNGLLAVLNWRSDMQPDGGLPNLIPEAPIRSEEKGSIRFLDYLGLEAGTDNPLLIVETKRPSAPLPPMLRSAANYSEVVSIALTEERLKGEWKEWLNDLKDYVGSAHGRTQKAPRRVVLTNGEWVILFLDPLDAFREDGKCDPNRILVFLDRNDIEARFNELFQHLEHQQVLGETPALTPGELLFHLQPQAVDLALHGLHLRYIEQAGIFQSAPVIKVAPVVFLRSRYGAWFRVEAPPKD